ncbi:uncharacterized protein LOC124275044 [Haliotis rubra]|uniref:uncharacterized protein LOC124275044 n=1 Tax=Haliotis rubra TaxID=36100 RepID=UPI001EE56459|nr:uncharacterized protein LOC124275044 [Haliotis rubra]
MFPLRVFQGGQHSACNGKLRTTLEMENPRLTSEHNHPADPTAVEAVKFRTKLKEQALTSNDKDDQPAIEDDRKKMSALEEAAVHSSRFILCAQKKLAEPAPGVRQPCNSQGLDGENPQVTSSRFILCARKREDGPAPGVRQPGNRQGFSFISTSHKQFAKPLAEAMELDITAESGIGSEKIDITQKFGGLAGGVMTLQAIPRRDIRKGCISTDQNRNFTVTTVSSSTQPTSMLVSSATKEAAKSVIEVMETQTSRDDLRNEKVDMMPSIYILNAQKKPAETIDLSETSSRTDEEEDEIHLSVGHKGRRRERSTPCEHKTNMASAGRARVGPPKYDPLMSYDDEDHEVKMDTGMKSNRGNIKY